MSQFQPRDIRAEFAFTEPKGERVPMPDASMRILIVGDFTGRASRPGDAIGRARSFDVDTLDDLPGRMGAEIVLERGEDAALTIPIGAIDDFHPDHLLARVPIFHELLDVRRRLRDPATFADAAAEVRSWSPAPPAPPAPAPGTTPPKPASGGGNLASLLGMRGDAGGASSSGDGRRRSPADALIRSLVRAHIVDDPDPSQQPMVASVEEGLAAQLREVLHDPAFQQVEANWRSARELATSIETDQGVALSLLDASKQELLADLAQAADPDASALARALADSSAGGEESWTLVVCLFSFEPTPEDAAGLLRLAQCARRRGGSIAATAAPALVGCNAFIGTPNPSKWRPLGDEAWMALRRRPEASHVCLTAPRVLLRLPYGAQTDPIDTMPFEEASGGPLEHEHYLWGAGGPVVSRVLASLFVEHEQFIFPPGVATIDGFPAHSWKDADGEPEMQPCAEAWLTEQSIREIESRGVTPLASVRRRDAVQAHPPRAFVEGAHRLAGPWS